MSLNIVLVEAEIPQNTGNIVRTCACLGVRLHLVGPLGFSISDKYLKRAGLDYWDMLDIVYYESYNEFLEKNQGNFYYLTTKGDRIYSKVNYEEGDYLIFGKETFGLPERILKNNYDKCIRIPMKEGARSLNLSNAVAIVLYHAMDELGFPNLEVHGKLTGRED